MINRIKRIFNKSEIHTYKEIAKVKDISIFQDETRKVRVDFPDEEYSKIIDVHKIVLEINNMPMGNKDMDYYAKEIANIYQISLKGDLSIAKEYAENIKEIIERNLFIRRKFQLVMPCIIGFGSIMLMTGILINGGNHMPILNPMLYGSLGGLLAVIIRTSQLSIDYSVKREYIIFEAFKIIILSNIMAIIAGITIDSEFILSNLSIKSNEDLMFLIYTICGFSQTFMPNTLKNFEFSNL